MKEDNRFLNKKCKLTYNNGFILEGIVKEMNMIGVIFETTQKISFISWLNIRELVTIGNR